MTDNPMSNMPGRITASTEMLQPALGDLLLTWAAAPEAPRVWQHGPLCIQRIAQRRAVWPVSPDADPDGAAGTAPAPSGPGRP
ncbi:MAG TPA: hypothetical protein VM431_04635 [Phycisphaerae bacterium]|nr:hypothetical protein [Phycisphaerae bacterium]HUU90700.1 hypothetical protein [Phycisphaerae bacterium]